jgi:hypothetical protein
MEADVGQEQGRQSLNPRSTNCSDAFVLPLNWNGMIIGPSVMHCGIQILNCIGRIAWDSAFNMERNCCALVQQEL